MSLVTLIYWEWHLIPRLLLSSIFTRLLKRLVSWGTPGKYSMIDCFLGDAVVVLFCLFINTVVQCGARPPKHKLNYWTVQWVVPVFFIRAVIIFLLFYTVRSVAVLCMLSKIRCDAIHPLNLWRSTCCAVCASASSTKHWSLIDIYSSGTSQNRRTFIPLSVSQWNDLSDPVFDSVGLTGGF